MIRAALILATALTTSSPSWPGASAPQCSPKFDGVIDQTIRASILIGRAREAYDLHRMDRYDSYSEQVTSQRRHLDAAIKSYAACQSVE